VARRPQQLGRGRDGGAVDDMTSVDDTEHRLGHVPSRLGTTLELDGDRLIAHLTMSPALCPRGATSLASVLLLIDALTGYSVPVADDVWALTSDISIRLPLEPAPPRIDATVGELHGSRSSATFEAFLTVDGRPFGSAFARFAKVARSPEDVGKAALDPKRAATKAPIEPLGRPLRVEAGFESRDPSRGAVAASLRQGLLNVAGSLQGAIVAGLAEAAAEDLVDHVLGTDVLHVATEMEIRYLAANRVSPIVSEARFVGDPTDGLVRVDLFEDDGRGRLTTSVALRLRPAPT
jgi:acyl-coenzyme A thioesterase PaaI-like protein